MLFLYKLKTLLGEKELIFWTLLFPIILSTLFMFAFSNLSTTEDLETINIGIIQSEAEEASSALYKTLDESYLNEKTKMFNITVTTENDYKALLNEDSVDGVISSIEGKIILYLNDSGINQMIIKTFLEEFIHVSSGITKLMILSNGTLDSEALVNELANQENILEKKDTKTNTANTMVICYYSLIGMALIYGGFFGTNEIINIQPNQSDKGARISVSPVKRWKLLATNLGAVILVHFIEMVILVLYLTFVVKIDFGANLPYLYGFIFLGSICGIMYGAFLSLACKNLSEEGKITVTSIIGILGGFLSGMMAPYVKYFIAKNLPILSYINPVAVMTDGLYSLHYYQTYERFTLQVIALAILTLIFSIGSILLFRRDKYESI